MQQRGETFLRVTDRRRTRAPVKKISARGEKSQLRQRSFQFNFASKGTNLFRVIRRGALKISFRFGFVQSKPASLHFAGKEPTSRCYLNAVHFLKSLAVNALHHLACVWHRLCEEFPQPKENIMPKISTLEDAYVEQLRDLYNAESQLVKALPKMAKAASSAELKNGFLEHLEQTKEHVVRLEQIFEELDEKPTGKKCQAMAGLVEEGSETISEDAAPAVKDALLIAAAQRVEHYEIAGYGTVKNFATLLGHDEAAKLLDETLQEEVETDEKLTEASKTINAEANEGGESEEEDDDEEKTASSSRRK